MKHLITGINGFVGPHMAKLLMDEGHDVVGLIRGSNGNEQIIEQRIGSEYYKKIEFLYADLFFESQIDELFRDNKFDGVFHLAAQSHPPTSFKFPKMTFDVNALGTIYIVEALIRHQPECRLMFCSTSEVYGICDSEKPINEEYRLGPINPYGLSKAAADMYVRERAKSCGYPFFVTRAFSHCGSGRGRQFSISSDAYQLIKIKKGLQEPIVRVGNLESKRVVMDARDCVKAYYLLMQKADPGEAFNIGNDPDKLFSMGELLDKMTDILGLQVERKLDDKLYRPIDIPVQIPDNTKVKQLTGWELEISIDGMLKSLLEYWDGNIRE